MDFVFVEKKSEHMSRGFVKESDQEEIPLVLPRAFLPPGVNNYVTPQGLAELKEERADLIRQRDELKNRSFSSHHIQINHLTAQLKQLEDRIRSARLINLAEKKPDKVQFGARVKIEFLNENETVTYTIVGVDEADIQKNKISFLSPIARVLMGKKVNEEVVLKTPKGQRLMKILSIKYHA